jgi:hypothetical protein
MGYVVSEDLQTNSNDYPVKIHKATCKYYLNSKLDAKTMRWSHIFKTPEEAELFARSTGRNWKWAAECAKP